MKSHSIGSWRTLAVGTVVFLISLSLFGGDNKYFSLPGNPLGSAVPTAPDPFVSVPPQDVRHLLDKYSLLTNCNTPELKELFSGGLQEGIKGTFVYPPALAAQDSAQAACSNSKYSFDKTASSIFDKLGSSNYSEFSSFMLETEVALAGFAEKRLAGQCDQVCEKQEWEAIANARCVLKNDFKFPIRCGQNKHVRRIRLHTVPQIKALANQAFGVADHYLTTQKAKHFSPLGLFTTPELQKIEKKHCCLRGFEFGQSELLRKMEVPVYNDPLTVQCREIHKKAFDIAEKVCSAEKASVCAGFAQYVENSRKETLKGCFNLGFRSGLFCMPNASQDCRAQTTHETSHRAESVPPSEEKTRAGGDSQAGSADSQSTLRSQ